MNEQTDMIDKYLTGRMDAAESQAFLHRLDGDPELREALEHQRELATIIGMAALQEQLAVIHEEATATPGTITTPEIQTTAAEAPVITLSPRRRSRFQRYSIAAIIILLVGIGASLLYEREDTHERLFNRFYQPAPGLPTTMGAADNSVFANAMVDYKTGDYDRAISGFGSLLTPAASDTVRFFLAAAYLGGHRYDSAQTWFGKVTDSTLRQTAIWYQALASLRLTPRNRSIRNLLKPIAGSPTNPYRDQAADLLQALSK